MTDERVEQLAWWLAQSSDPPPTWKGELTTWDKEAARELLAEVMRLNGRVSALEAAAAAVAEMGAHVEEARVSGDSIAGTMAAEGLLNAVDALDALVSSRGIRGPAGDTG